MFHSLLIVIIVAQDPFDSRGVKMDLREAVRHDFLPEIPSDFPKSVGLWCNAG